MATILDETTTAGPVKIRLRGLRSADLAASAPVNLSTFASLLFGLVVFGAAALAFGIWRFEQKDF